MNTKKPILPGLATSSPATAADIDFVDAAIGIGTVSLLRCWSQSYHRRSLQGRAAENPVATVDNPPAPWADEV